MAAARLQPKPIAALLAGTLLLTGCSTVENVGARIASWLPDFGRKPALSDPIPTPPPRDTRPLTDVPVPGTPAVAAARPATPPPPVAMNAGPSPATDAMNLAIPQDVPRPPLAGGAAAPLLTAENAPAPAPTAPPPVAAAPALTAAVPVVPPAPVAAPPAVTAMPAPMMPAPAPAARANVQMQTEFNQLKPSIERLVAIEDDLDELVAQLFTVITGQNGQQQAVNTAPAAPARPTTTPAPAPAAGGAPISLFPGQPAARQPAAPTPVPAATPPAAAPAAAVPAPVAQTGAFALHLASYRRVETAKEGWTELARELPTPLNGLRPGTAVFDKEREGRYYRLMAGPVASRSDAEARCRVIQQAGEYCAVMPYAGTTPLN